MQQGYVCNMALAFLHKPFPLNNSLKQELKLSFLISAFVFLFLFIFQPFGINNIGGSKLMVTGAFGAICFVCMMLVELTLPRMFGSFYNEENWTTGKNILHSLAVVLVVAIGNFLLASYWNFHEMSVLSFLLFVGYTLVIGVFPVSMHTLLQHARLNHKYVEQSVEFAEHFPSPQTLPKQDSIAILDEENREAVQLEKHELYFAKSSDNYVEIHFMQNGEYQNHLVRNSLKSIEDQLAKHTEFYRCHRSYLVNTNHIKNVGGNARGLKLKLHQTLPEIPVSRSKNQEFSNRFGSHSSQ
ncbi:MAG: LytTR family transcriptional regulator DNA-binding domain-containing protein [Bacteroidetes bacterium]|nr:LytTR family transcriptional regulator DNA-binding domain-containing protein [Bacteroidota bacterium]